MILGCSQRNSFHILWWEFLSVKWLHTCTDTNLEDSLALHLSDGQRSLRICFWACSPSSNFMPVKQQTLRWCSVCFTLLGMSLQFWFLKSSHPCFWMWPKVCSFNIFCVKGRCFIIFAICHLELEKIHLYSLVFWKVLLEIRIIFNTYPFCIDVIYCNSDLQKNVWHL